MTHVLAFAVGFAVGSGATVAFVRWVTSVLNAEPELAANEKAPS